jgi:hypothetical protein
MPTRSICGQRPARRRRKQAFEPGSGIVSTRLKLPFCGEGGKARSRRIFLVAMRVRCGLILSSMQASPDACRGAAPQSHDVQLLRPSE